MKTRARQWALIGATLLTATLAAFARPGEGIKIGNLRLSPFLDGAITYDSNVFLEGANEENDDFYLDLVGGVGFLNKTDRMSLLGRGWLQGRWYDEYTARDTEGFGEKLGLVWGELEDLQLEVNQKFVRLDDYELTPRSVDTLNTLSQNLMLTEDRTERVKRDLFDVGAVAGRYVTDKLEADAGLSFGSVEYNPDLDPDEYMSDIVLGTGSLSVNTNGLYDWYEIRAQGELTYQLTDKTSALLTGQYSDQNSDGFEDDSVVYLVRVGLLTYATKKVTFKGGVGFETYDFAGKSDLGDDLDITIFNYDASGTWQATEKLLFEVSGRNAVQPATQYSANIKEVTLAQLGAIYDITARLNISLAGSYRHDDYVGRIELLDGTLAYKEREHFGGRLRLNYKPKSPWFDLYAEGTYEDVNDNLEDDYTDYEQWRLTAGVALRY